MSKHKNEKQLREALEKIPDERIRKRVRDACQRKGLLPGGGPADKPGKGGKP